MTVETKGFVNNNGSLKPETRLEVVNNKELRMEAQLKFVKSNREGVENHFETESGDLD